MSKQREFCCTCGKQGNHKLCSKCHVAAYCCKECQDKGKSTEPGTVSSGLGTKAVVWDHSAPVGGRF